MTDVRYVCHVDGRKGWSVGCAVLIPAALGVVVFSKRSPSDAGKNAVPPPRASVRFPNPWPDPPPADVAALFDDLRLGDTVGGYRVRAISPVHDARIVVDVEKNDAGFRVWVERRKPGGRVPPAKTSQYALFMVQPRPSPDAINDEDQAAVLKGLVERIRRKESSVPVPSGL